VHSDADSVCDASADTSAVHVVIVDQHLDIDGDVCTNGASNGTTNVASDVASDVNVNINLDGDGNINLDVGADIASDVYLVGIDWNFIGNNGNDASANTDTNRMCRKTLPAAVWQSVSVRRQHNGAGCVPRTWCVQPISVLHLEAVGLRHQLQQRRLSMGLVWQPVFVRLFVHHRV
jgi:hypothetical protein